MHFHSSIAFLLVAALSLSLLPNSNASPHLFRRSPDDDNTINPNIANGFQQIGAGSHQIGHAVARGTKGFFSRGAHDIKSWGHRHKAALEGTLAGVGAGLGAGLLTANPIAGIAVGTSVGVGVGVAKKVEENQKRLMNQLMAVQGQPGLGLAVAGAVQAPGLNGLPPQMLATTQSFRGGVLPAAVNPFSQVPGGFVAGSAATQQFGQPMQTFNGGAGGLQGRGVLAFNANAPGGGPESSYYGRGGGTSPTSGSQYGGALPYSATQYGGALPYRATRYGGPSYGGGQGPSSGGAYY